MTFEFEKHDRITVKQVVQVTAPFALTGTVLADFMSALNKVYKEGAMDMTLELTIEGGPLRNGEGYQRVTPPTDPEFEVQVPEGAQDGDTVEFVSPTGSFGEGEVLVPTFKGRADLTVKTKEEIVESSLALSEALTGRKILPDNVSFNGRALEAIRSRERMTQRQMGTKIGVSGGAIGFWERGKGKPTIENVFALSEALGVSANKLLTISR